MMNDMSLHPYPKGAPTGCQISIEPAMDFSTIKDSEPAAAKTFPHVSSKKRPQD